MKTFDQIGHKNEIETSRVGGFGGSDAAMFYRIGTRGLEGLTKTDRKRIAVAKGLIPYASIPETEEMARGHRFEDFVASQALANGFCFNREAKIKSSFGINFDVFAHSDFEFDGNVIECKCTKATAEETAKKYEAQLQWYYMLGAREVTLYHHMQCEPFDVNDVTSVNIARDDGIVGNIRKGIALLDKAWDTWTYEQEEEWTDTDLLPHEQQELLTLRASMLAMKRAEAEIAEIKERLTTLMRENGVTKLTAPGLSITYVGQSEARTFNKAALANAHPEIDLTEYEKVSKRSDYVTIKTN